MGRSSLSYLLATYFAAVGIRDFILCVAADGDGKFRLASWYCLTAAFAVAIAVSIVRERSDEPHIPPHVPPTDSGRST